MFAHDNRKDGALVGVIALGVLIAVAVSLAVGVAHVLHGLQSSESASPKTLSAQLADPVSRAALRGKLRDLSGNIEDATAPSGVRGDDIDEIHLREDLLLEHTTWIDAARGTVRIPIARAMELVAARGLPVREKRAATGAAAQSKSPDRMRDCEGDACKARR